GVGLGGGAGRGRVHRCPRSAGLGRALEHVVGHGGGIPLFVRRAVPVEGHRLAGVGGNVLPLEPAGRSGGGRRGGRGGSGRGIGRRGGGRGGGAEDQSGRERRAPSCASTARAAGSLRVHAKPIPVGPSLNLHWPVGAKRLPYLTKSGRNASIPATHVN